MRWLRFIPLLSERGYHITVVTPKYSISPHTDESLIKLIPSNVKVIRTEGKPWLRHSKSLNKAHIPYGELTSYATGNVFKRILLWIRLNLVIPDMRRSWNPKAFRAASRELQSSKYDSLISTGPPHSTHLVARKLAKKFRIRWIADFRDPWTTIHYLQLHPPSRFARSIHKAMERKVVSDANTVLTVSQHIVDDLPMGNKHVLYNGYNAQDFEGLTFIKSDKFRIKYIGQQTAGQDIAGMIKCIVSALQDKDYELCFIGTSLDAKASEEAKSNQSVQIHPFTSHQEALQEMLCAELLLLVINRNPANKGILTTKLFEYLGSKSKILCIGPKDGEAAILISAFNAGLCFDYDDHKGISEAIQNYYRDFLIGKDLKNSCDVSSLSVQKQIEQLIELL